MKRCICWSWVLEKCHFKQNQKTNFLLTYREFECAWILFAPLLKFKMRRCLFCYSACAEYLHFYLQLFSQLFMVVFNWATKDQEPKAVFPKLVFTLIAAQVMAYPSLYSSSTQLGAWYWESISENSCLTRKGSGLQTLLFPLRWLKLYHYHI